MRTLILSLPLCALLLAGCDRSPTAPEAPHRDAPKPEPLLLTVSGWSRVDLPFRPAAINDAGAIVGSQNGEAVLWQNGTLTVLPHRAGIPGPYRAIDITPKGMILGEASGHGLYWLLPTAPPNEITDPFRSIGKIEPVAMNDAYTVVGYTANGADTAFRWSPTTGVQKLFGYASGYFLGLSANGYAAGTVWTPDAAGRLTCPVPVRWSPTGVLTRLYTPNGCGGVMSMNDGGDILGVSWSGPLGALSITDVIWRLDGSIAAALPGVSIGGQRPYKLSNAGRIVFASSDYDGRVYTYYAGALTWVTNPSTDQVSAVDVNTCGSMVAALDGSDAGYLWKKVGLYPCDGQRPTTTGTLLAAKAR